MLVEIERRSRWSRLTLNRPERANALGPELVEALLDATAEALADNPGLLVIQGRGPSFCAGFDLSGLEAETDATLAYRLLRIEQLLQRIHTAPCHTIALVQGTVAGAGADLVAACRRRIGAPGARFRFPGIRLGVVLGTRRLLERIGSEAYGVILEQRTVSTDEAERLGLLSEIQESADWEATVTEVGEAVSRLPPAALAFATGADGEAGQGDRDLGLLARSLLEPGLKDRILAHGAAVRVERTNR